MSKEKKEVESTPEASATETLDDKIAKAVAAALTQALPLAAGVMAQSLTQAQQTLKNQEQLDSAKYRLTGERCEICRQVLPRGVKQGEHKHKKVVSFPKDPRNGKSWPGYKVNGVLYLSDHMNHHIDVPEDCNIEYALQSWEEEEANIRFGKVTQLNSGDLNNPRTQGWR